MWRQGRCRVVAWGTWLPAVVLSAAICQGQVASDPVASFHKTLDPRVFQLGGYGPWPEPLGPIFREAAEQYDVPETLLLALGHIGSAFENRGDQPTIEFGYGVMALRANTTGGDSLALAATLLNAPVETIKTDPRLNILGAAAVLDVYAAEAGIDRTRGLTAWLAPVERYAGLDAENSRFFAMEVFERLQRGFRVTNTSGEELAVEPQTIAIDLTTLAPPKGTAPMVMLSADYPPAIWDPAASCNYSAYYTAKDTVIVHTIEGSAAGCRSWFKNCAAQVSAHYVVSEAGGVWQCVLEDYKAWHVGCYNSRSLGIEHEGYAASPSHPQALYDASALLTRHMCDRWGIPKEKRSVGPGILGHIDVTNCCCGTHTDPGAGWDWTYYINQVKGTPPPPVWAASYSNQSYPSTMTAGSTAIVWAEFRNDGTGHWKHAETRLGTSSPQDRTSPFCTPSNWVGCNRPTDVDQSDVAPGAIGRFTFILTAPAATGTYTEKYRLVREGVTWFGPEITWTITVTASQGNLNGTVTSAVSGAAIAGASVTLSGIGSTTTNSSGAYSFNNVAAGSYTVSVSASGYSGASSSVTITAGQTATKNFALTPTDTQAPTTPTGLTATATGPTSVQLGWSASSDNVGVAGYDIRRNGSIIGSSTATNYTDSTAAPLTTYTYEVRAKDAVPNYSAWSEPAQVTTPPTPPQPTIVFSDGFNGNLNNWTQGASAYDYSATVNHGTYAGAGAAYMAAGQSDQMYRAFTRPFAQGKVWGWYYDGKGGWKASVCGWSYRQALSLRDFDGAAKMYIDNEFYNTPDNSKYYFRLIGTGGIPTHTAYATRNPNTDCSGAWIYFETTVTPGAPNASPTGTFVAKVADGAGTTTTTQNLTTDYFSYGIGRITLGLGISSTNEGYWDDIAFEATPPGVPVMNAATILSDRQIRWNFSPADNNAFGFDVADASGTVLSPSWPATGWLNHDAGSWTETGLTPNTSYSRKVRAWNGTLNSASYSNTVSAWTLSTPPAAGSVTPDASVVCAGDDVTWTAVGGFGAGTVQHYKYAWDQSPTHTFNGTEPVWSNGTITLPASEAGAWYLHVQGFNGAGVPNGTYDYGVTAVPETAVTTPPVHTAVCTGQTATFTTAAVGVNLTYQWQKNGANVADDGRISGANASVLSIANASAADEGNYRCVITGDCGSVTTVEAELAIKEPLQITEHPFGRAVHPNTTVRLSVTATGTNLAYQWQKNGENLIDGGHYYDVATPTLTVASAGRAESGVYRCLVTSDCGSATSDSATLMVGAPGDMDLDGDVDGTDYGMFSGCFNGTGNPISSTCDAADLNADNSVDGVDFGLFAACFNGTGNSAACR